MQAIRVHPAPKHLKPFSPSNPAPPSALQLDEVPIPRPENHGDILIKVKATAVIRDSLTWPETYAMELAILGHDFAGIVEDGGTTNFQQGDEVFGMASVDSGSTWAEYTIIREGEIARKPRDLSWEEAASLPLSALTAFEALFEHAGLPWPESSPGEDQKQEQPRNGKRVLVTGSSGGVGIYLIQLAAIAGLHVVAASSSNARNETFLKSLGATEVTEYSTLKENPETFSDYIIDTVGGEILAGCWSWISRTGTLVSVDSASSDFVNDRRGRGLCKGKENVRALFFIVKSNGKALERLAGLAGLGRLKPFVLKEFELAQARQAYGQASSKSSGRGKVVIKV